MIGAALLSVAAERPKRSMSNSELPAELGTSDEWIQARTGIAARGVAGADESILNLSAGAASKAIAAAGVDPATIDLTILATTSNPVPVPGIAPALTDRLGLQAGAFDLQAACAGFSYGIAIAADSVRGGSARNVLVVGADRLTDRMDWQDRNTCYLFGDGAGAAIVGSVASVDDGIGPVVWGSDGSKADHIAVPLGGTYVQMDGPGVFRWAISEVAGICRQACERAGVAPADLAAFVPHQANLRIIEAVARSLDLAEATVVADDVRTSGNTSAASIPLALSRLKEHDRVTSGALVLLVGFGAGMTWSAQIIRCP